MAFQRTLRYVQIARAATFIFAIISFCLYLFVLEQRDIARADLVKQILASASGLMEETQVTHAAWGSLSLFALGVSFLWNGLSFFDLVTKKHYRFGRRVYIFVDIIAALLLLLFGFLNFVYDALVYYALEIATHKQYSMEITAVVFLAVSCIAHIAFFCYGCKDPGATTSFNIENAPLASNGAPHDYNRVMTPRSRSTSMRSMEEDQELEDIELDKKEDQMVSQREIRVVIKR